MRGDNADPVWIHAYGGSAFDEVFGMTLDGLGFVYAVGSWRSKSATFANATIDRGERTDEKGDIFIVKVRRRVFCGGWVGSTRKPPR